MPAEIGQAAGLTALEFIGRDAVKFLNNFCTADLKTLQMGVARELMLLNPKGHVLLWGCVWLTPSGLQMIGTGLEALELIAHLDRYLFAEDVKMEAWQIQYWSIGTGDEIDASRLDAVTPPAELGAIQSGVERSPWLHNLIEVSGLPPGWQVWHAAKDSLAVLTPLGLAPSDVVTALRAAPMPSENRPDLVGILIPEAPQHTFEAWRVRQGLPRVGVDTVATSLPQELDRTDLAISFSKGCYLGQETVARLDALGHVNWQVRRVALTNAWPTDETQSMTAQTASAEESPTLAEVRLDGKAVGHLTSAQGRYGLARLRAAAITAIRTSTHQLTCFVDDAPINEIVAID